MPKDKDQLHGPLGFENDPAPTPTPPPGPSPDQEALDDLKKLQEADAKVKAAELSRDAALAAQQDVATATLARQAALNDMISHLQSKYGPTP